MASKDKTQTTRTTSQSYGYNPKLVDAIALDNMGKRPSRNSGLPMTKEMYIADLLDDFGKPPKKYGGRKTPSNKKKVQPKKKK